MGLSVEITGLKELEADFKRSGYEIKPLVKTALFNSTREVQRNIRNEAPHRTGALQRSILQNIDYPVGKVTSQEKYATWVENGTAPHIIRAKNKSVLANVKMGLVFGKVVHHPGTKPNPFIRRGFEASTTYINEQFAKAVEIAVMIMAGKK